MTYDDWKLESPEDELGRVRGLYAVAEEEEEEDDEGIGLPWDEDEEDGNSEDCDDAEEDHMSKHTPGPWEYEPGGWGGDESVGVQPAPGMIFHCYDQSRKASVGIAALERPTYWDRENGTIAIGQEDANARLIAAAPDLLAASKLALETLTNNGFSGVSVNALTAAIAKAEGGDA